MCQSNTVVIHVPGTPVEDACGITGCTRKHEEKHVEQVLAQNARICQGMPNGARVKYSGFKEQQEMEREAFCSVTVPCLRKLKVKCPEGCETFVKQYLTFFEGECRKYGGDPGK